MTEVREQVIVSEREGHTQISWRAILAGMVLTISTAWLMLLLGTAIGVSVADASDMEAIGAGFGIGSMIWMIVTGLLAFFAGSVLAARLSGDPDETTGMMHGITLWSASTVLMLFLGYHGVANMVQVGASATSGTANVAASAAASARNAAMSGETDIDNTVQSAANSPLTAKISAQVKRAAAKQVAKRDTEGGANVSQEEVRQAIEQVDAQTLQSMSYHLVAGEPQAAKDVLTANTTLSEAEVNEIVNGVEKDVEAQVKEFKAEAAQVVEKASTYTQAVLWAAFGTAAIGLLVSILGGWMGAETVERLRTVVATREVKT